MDQVVEAHEQAKQGIQRVVDAGVDSNKMKDVMDFITGSGDVGGTGEAKVTPTPEEGGENPIDSVETGENVGETKVTPTPEETPKQVETAPVKKEPSLADFFRESPDVKPEEVEEKPVDIKDDPAVVGEYDKFPEGPKQSIKNLRDQRDEARSELKKLSANLERRPTEEAFQELQEKVAKYEEALKTTQDRLGFYEVEELDEFKQKVVSPRSDTIDTILTLADSYGVDRDAVKGLLSRDPMTRNKKMGEEFPDFRDAVASHLATLDRLTVQERKLREMHPTLRARAIEQQQKQQEALRAEQFTRANKLIDTALAEVSGKPFPGSELRVPYFNEIPGDAEHNAKVSELRSLTKDVLSKGNESTIYKIAALGASVPYYHLEVSRLQRALDEANSELDKLTGASVGSVGSPGQPAGGSATGGENEDIDAFLGRVLKTS